MRHPLAMQRFLILIVLFASGTAVSGRAAEDAPAVNLKPRPRSQSTPMRVRVHFDVGGDLTMEGQGQDEKAKVPMSVVAKLSYRELPLPPSETDSPSNIEKSVRFYDKAEATIKIAKGGTKLELPENKRLIVASTGADHAHLLGPHGPLTREQLDLIDIPAGTHVLDTLLPGGRRSVGDTWKHDRGVMQEMLGLDEVTVCEVESVLIGVERGFAQMRLAGTVQGKTDGAFTELEVKAGYLFDPRQARITRLNLAFSEKRNAGRIGPAVDVTGKLTLELDPLPAGEQIPDEQLAIAKSAVAGEELRLIIEDETSGLRLLHDRQWHVTSEGSERFVLRWIDGGEFIAQCSISVRPERQEGRQSTIAEFERDVRFSLGERFESLISTGEWTSSAGLRCYRLVVHGKVDELPVEWRYFLAFPPSGPSVAVAVSVEPRHTEQLGDADRELVESIELTQPAETEPPATEAAAQTPVDRTSR